MEEYELEELFGKQYVVFIRKNKHAIYTGVPYRIVSLHSDTDECRAAYEDIKKQLPDADIHWGSSSFIFSPDEDVVARLIRR